MFFDRFGAECSGEGFTKMLHDAPWMEDDSTLDLPPRQNFGCIYPPVIAPRVQYSMILEFDSLGEFHNG